MKLIFVFASLALLIGQAASASPNVALSCPELDESANAIALLEGGSASPAYKIPTVGHKIAVGTEFSRVFILTSGTGGSTIGKIVVKALFPDGASKCAVTSVEEVN